jgi:hypothetical protein
MHMLAAASWFTHTLPHLKGASVCRMAPSLAWQSAVARGPHRAWLSGVQAEVNSGALGMGVDSFVMIRGMFLWCAPS